MWLAAKKRQRDQTETAQATQKGAGALRAPKPTTRPSAKFKLAQHHLPCVMHATGRAMGRRATLEV